MIKKVKKWLGIEGVKLSLEVPYEIDFREEEIHGVIELMSMHEQHVERIDLKIVETYTRGRYKKKRIDEYKLGALEIEGPWKILPEEITTISFTLPFTRVDSDMDKLQQSNFLVGGFVKVAKKLKNVKSEYRIEAEATVQGTVLSPFDKKIVKVS